MYRHFISLATIFLKRKNFFPWRNKLGLWVTTLLSMELFSIISSACYNQFPKQNGSGLRNEILKCMSIPTPRSYTPGCTINPYNFFLGLIPTNFTEQNRSGFNPTKILKMYRLLIPKQHSDCRKIYDLKNTNILNQD